MNDRIAGSFRDPSGYVFCRENRILRAVDLQCYELLRQLEKTGLLRELIGSGRIVDTHFMDDSRLLETLREEHAGFEHFLEHARLEQITYPYEWTQSMLADAGVLTLDLQIRLLESGYSLKDATAYNIQFVGARPTFIDLSSIERPERLDVWFAMGQFYRMFLYPLLLLHHRNWDLRSYFLASLDGRDAEQVSRSFGRLERWRPSLMFDVSLPALLGRRADKKDVDGQRVIKKSNTKADAQLVNLRRLRRKIVKLVAKHSTSGVWSDYTRTCTYDEPAESSKKSLVKEFLEVARPKTVLDIGCNTGDYSLIAAEFGARVLAADGDHDAVEILYRRLKSSPANVTPVVVDLANPSPAIGFRNDERASFLTRINADCVFALALLHHLLVSANMPLSGIRDLFSDMTNDYLILEFVPTDDIQFRRLLRFRVDLFKGFDLSNCRSTFAKCFEILRDEAIPNSPRRLLLLRKKNRLLGS